MDSHKQKYALLRCFYRSSWTNVYQTFCRYRAGYGLYYLCIEIVMAHLRDITMVTNLWKIDTLSSFGVLAFHKEWKDRSADCCINSLSLPIISR